MEEGTTYGGWCQPWIGGPGVYKKADGTYHSQQASKKDLSTAYISSHAYMFMS